MRIPTHRTSSLHIRNLLSDHAAPTHFVPCRRSLAKRTAWNILPVILLAGLVAALAVPSPAISQMSGELELGLDVQKRGNLKDAIEIYTEVLRKDARSAPAYNWRGMAYDDQGEPDKALADFNKAIEVAPNYADAYNNRGEVFRKKNMLPQALNDYNRAVQLEPNFAEAFFNLGLINEMQNKPLPAANSYDSYLKLKADAPERAELEAKIKTLRQAAAAQARPGPPAPGAPPAAGPPPAAAPPPAAQKPAEQKAADVKPPERPAPPRPGLPTEPRKAMPPPPAGLDLGIPFIPPIPTDPDALAGFAAGMGIISIVVNLVIYLFVAFMLYFIAKKTNTALPWLAFIPIAQVVLMIMVSGKPIWWLALFLLLIIGPIVAGILSAVDPTGGIIAMALIGVSILIPVVAWLFVCLGIASARGKSVIWGILLFIPCTNPIALAYLGLSK